MSQERVNVRLWACLRCAIAIPIAYYAWNSPSFVFFAGIILIPILLSLTAGKWEKIFLISAYFLGASFELIKGAGNFYGNEWIGTVSVLSWCLFQVIPWIPYAFVKNNSFRYKLAAVSFPFVVYFFLPPFNYLSLFNPILASGIFFPGVGIFALILFVLLWVLIDSKRFFTVSLLLILSTCLNIFYSQASFNLTVADINTSFPDYSGENISPDHSKQSKYHFLGARLNRLMECRDLAESALDNGAQFIVFPESVAGIWIESDLLFWSETFERAKNMGSIILMGGWDYSSSKNNYYKQIRIFGANASPKKINARYPMPGGDFKWFSDVSTYPPDWFGFNSTQGVFECQYGRFAVLNCYEEIAPYTAVLTYFQRPRAVFVMSNLSWAKGTTLARSMKNISILWGRIFDIPTFYAVNS